MKNLKINILKTIKKDRYTSLFIVTERYYFYKLNNEVGSTSILTRALKYPVKYQVIVVAISRVINFKATTQATIMMII